MKNEKLKQKPLISGECMSVYCIMYIGSHLGVFNSTYFSIKNSFCFFQLIQKNSSDHSSSFFFLQKMRGRSFNTLNFNYYVCLVTNQKQFPFHVEFVFLFDLLSVVDSMSSSVYKSSMYTRSSNNTHYAVSICDILKLKNLNLNCTDTF